MSVLTPTSSRPVPSLVRGRLKIAHPVRQRGVVLFFALIALVVLTLAGLAIMRAVDTATLIAGNLAFRQSALQSADYGIEDARTWLMARSVTELNADQPSVTSGSSSTQASWYWANWQDTFDPHTYDWTSAYVMSSSYVGNSVSYVIHRMCQYSGDYTDPSKYCLKAQLTQSPGDSTRVTSYGQNAPTGSNTTPYYRITARILGPRNTETFVQAIIF